MRNKKLIKRILATGIATLLLVTNIPSTAFATDFIDVIEADESQNEDFIIEDSAEDEGLAEDSLEEDSLQEESLEDVSLEDASLEEASIDEEEEILISDEP